MKSFCLILYETNKASYISNRGQSIRICLFMLSYGIKRTYDPRSHAIQQSNYRHWYTEWVVSTGANTNLISTVIYY